MCRTFRSTRWPLAIAILMAFCIMAPSTAFGQAQCQASASIPIFPSAGGTCATGLVPGSTLDSLITLTNTSSTAPAPGVPVAAVWTGTITVTFPVGDTFVPVNATGCVANAAGVASCTAVANVVTITSTAGGVPLAAAASNVPIATIRTMVGGPAAPGCTPLPISAATPFLAGITTADAACTQQVVGGAQGSSGYNEVACLAPADCGADPGVCADNTCIANTCGVTNSPNTTVCRPGSGDQCDPAENCTGDSATCPADVITPVTTICRTGSGDQCDPDESCTGVAGQTCPADVITPVTTVCRTGSGDQCDPDESCTGVAGQTCPADVITPVTTICRTGSGDQCDPDESCTGVAGQTCPADVITPATTICREGDEATCDPSESCTGIAGQTCPADDPGTGCVTEACRTPGYWAQHAGQEKDCATNQTSLVIADVGSLTICGETINPYLGPGNTGVGHNDSPIEALCMPNKGDFRSQVVFHLTAAALNCAANGLLPDCSDSPLFGEFFTLCNVPAVCAPTTDANKALQTACVSALDCLNNGGHPVEVDGQIFCTSGTCSDNQQPCTPNNRSLCLDPATATCVPGSNCHELNFPNYPDSCAGSQKACQDANKSPCDIFSSSCL